MGLMAIYPKPKTSIPRKDHKIFPYLLTGLVINRPGMVWATDIGKFQDSCRVRVS
jgi:putative transposase